MEKAQFPQITEAEFEIMKILWELKSATSTQVVDALSGKTEWKPKTIHTLITRLVAKDAICAEKIDGKSYLYSPNISEADYRRKESSSFLQKLFNGSINMMVASFIKEQNLSKEEIEDLRKLLEEDGDDRCR